MNKKKSLRDMSAIEAIERLILTSDMFTCGEIACEFGKDLELLSQKAKAKMWKLKPPSKGDKEDNTKYFQAYTACKKSEKD